MPKPLPPGIDLSDDDSSNEAVQTSGHMEQEEAQGSKAKDQGNDDKKEKSAEKQDTPEINDSPEDKRKRKEPSCEKKKNKAKSNKEFHIKFLGICKRYNQGKA